MKVEYPSGQRNEVIVTHAVARMESAIKDLAEAGRTTAANMDTLAANVQANSKVTRLLTTIIACLVATIALSFLAIVTSNYGVTLNVTPSQLKIEHHDKQLPE